MPEEVGGALVGQCGGPALVLTAAASDGGARAGHKELGWLGMRGIGGGGRFIVDACLLVIDGPTAASRGACGRTNGGRTCGLWSAHERRPCTRHVARCRAQGAWGTRHLGKARDTSVGAWPKRRGRSGAGAVRAWRATSRRGAARRRPARTYFTVPLFGHKNLNRSAQSGE
jgi:hypothetical protein